MTLRMPYPDYETPRPLFGSEGHAAEIHAAVRKLVIDQQPAEGETYFGKCRDGGEVTLCQLEPTEHALFMMPRPTDGGALRQCWFVGSFETLLGEKYLQIASAKRRPFSGILSIEPLNRGQAGRVLNQVERAIRSIDRDTEIHLARAGFTYSDMLEMRSTFFVGRKGIVRARPRTVEVGSNL